jgi:SAM-dependent methyltransferase
VSRGRVKSTRSAMSVRCSSAQSCSDSPTSVRAAAAGGLRGDPAQYIRSQCHGHQTVSVSDHYADGTYRWWHLSVPSPELLGAITHGWFPPPGHGLDVGCGLGTEAAYLSGIGWRVLGVDLSPVAVASAVRLNPGPQYMRANLLRLPLQSWAFDAVLDRGCFQYLEPRDRPGYAAEVSRVLKPGGKLLLRTSLRAAGARNDIDEQVIRTVFDGWRIQDMTRAAAPSDTRTLEFLVVRLTSPLNRPRHRRCSGRQRAATRCGLAKARITASSSTVRRSAMRWRQAPEWQWHCS